MATLLLENVPEKILEDLTCRARAKGRTVTEELLSRIASETSGATPPLGEPILTDEMVAPYDLMPSRIAEQVPVVDGGVLRLEHWFEPIAEAN